MDTILQDLRYALRTLGRQPGFAAIAIFTLAIGIGANTAIYSVVDATLLRPLPFRDPAGLMKVTMIRPVRPGEKLRQPADEMVWSYPKYSTFRQAQEVFQDTAVYRSTNFSLTGTDEPERINGEVVGASYFSVLGIQPVAGRVFRADEDVVPERDFVAIISHSLWERRYGAETGVIGKTISLDLKSYTIVGVMPSGFQSLSGPSDIWVPAHTLSGPEELDQAFSHSWSVIGRLKAGVSVEQAKSAVTALGLSVNQAYPDKVSRMPWGAKARLLEETRTEPVIRQSVLVLFGAVSFVLLIACVNMANLLLARGSVRQREIAIRVAVGANRGRLIRQLLTESVVLGLLGAVASLAVAWLGVRALGSINPIAGNPFGRRLSGLTALGLGSIHLDSRALLFTFAVALCTGILFGLAPALQASRANVTDTMKSSGARPGSFAGLQLVTGKSVLVVVEVALAVVLLAGAGLMLKSFGRLVGTRSGVDPDHVLTVHISLPDAMFSTGSQAFFDPLEKRVAALPGVLSAGTSNCYPLAGGCNATVIWFRDRQPVTVGTEPLVGVHFVSPDYFKTLRIPLMRGRGFTAADRKGSPKVVLISDLAARTFWPGEDPIGKPVGVGQGGFGDRAEVIGIVGDVRYGQMDESPRPDVYISHLQSSRAAEMLFVRTAGNPTAITQAVEREVRALNRDLPVYDVKTMDQRIQDSTAKARFSAILLAVFAAIALALAAVGIYGVMSYLVTQRTREIGIRIALGATSGEVLALVVRRGAWLALAGIALGMAGALASTRVLATLLYEVKPGDPATYASIAIVLAVVALAAAYIPARRASSVDASAALRAE